MNLCLRADAQTNNQYSNITTTNVFSLSPNDFHDWSGQEESYYYSSLSQHIVLPETLPASEDTNDIWGLKQTDCSFQSDLGPVNLPLET
jgi:hypothetical protein